MQQFHNGNVMIAVIKLEVELILQPDKQNIYQNTSYSENNTSSCTENIFQGMNDVKERF